METWSDEGIVLSLRPHAESGAVLSVLTRDHGRHAGYVHGAKSSKMRGMLEAGNLIALTWSAKSEDQLGAFQVELVCSHTALLLDDPAKLSALQSACAIADKTLAEREPCHGVFDGLQALLSAFDTPVWMAAYVYWELGLLKSLGFGLDLEKCAVTGQTQDLVYVSPKTGRAVSIHAGEGYKDRLLHLPRFLARDGGGDVADLRAGLTLTGHFLEQQVFAESNQNLPEARGRLLQRLG